MELHEVIRAAREQSGLSLTEAAAKLGVGKATLSRLETNKGPITATRLTQLAKIYNMAPSTLLDGTMAPASDGHDLDQIGAMVEMVVAVALDTTPAPAPAKVRTATIEVLKLVLDESGQLRSTDPRRYLGVAKAMLAP